ncbi:MAG: 6-phosphofructokinase [Bacteriovoracaceae bacterium]
MADKSKIKTVGLLCSGGDSSGMNSAIRAIVRTGIINNLKMVGIKKGYAGLLKSKFVDMDVSSVGNIIQRGGTILQTSRCPEFLKPEGRKLAFDNLKKNNIDALIVIGGDGSFNGANLFNLETGMPVVGIPGTIDNDISGTEYTIGFDTAVSNAVEAVDKIRDTASSHERTFIVEVMGRSSQAIAIHVGVCTGAENVIFPTETKIPYQEIADNIQRGIKRGKNSSILIAAEGYKSGISYDIQTTLKEMFHIDSHVCILGHLQRGGSPTPKDRFVASEMGYLAVKALMNGEFPTATVVLNGKVQLTPLKNCLTKSNEYRPDLIELAKALSI